MKLTGEEAIKEVTSRFISEKHIKGLEQVMNDCHLVVAFRSAGAYTLEKLDNRAAAKPHSILAKSIKPSELGLSGDFPSLSLSQADKSIVQRDPQGTAKRFLCGLVGYRDIDGKVTGVYLSRKGQKFFRDETVTDKNGASYVSFHNTEALIERIVSMLAEEEKPLFCAPNFVTGDYDLHEIQILKQGRLVHIDADSQEEALYLQLLSLGSMGKYEGNQAYFPQFTPSEHSPIQHGAQDNYLKHMFLSEQDEELIPKVLIPDPDLAVYCGDTGGNGEWIVFDNSVDSNRNYHEILAIMEQVEALKGFYQSIDGEIPDHWRFDNWRVQDEMMEYFNLTPKEYNLLKKDHRV